ncbi:MAG: asparagine synthase (glutamine-hydrolyzing) [Acidobacteriota bacterium]|nr:MAG: asparagine synthase (glutamine-hydrolyzing) [Acidobacteriota bacterium]
MCGIAGIWNRDGQPVSSALLQRMSSSLAHRGPDGASITTESEIGFAFRRLAILDLSVRAQQPFRSFDQDLFLLFNGEIHNYRELRAELRKCGHDFESTGDTEVVLKAYIQWGKDCFRRFNGMWALAIWDKRSRELLLCRDRFGIKPLYYSVRGSRVVFGSEAKAILAAVPAELRANYQELGTYLLGGNPDGGSQTFFENVFSVPVSSYITVGPDSVRPPVSYWKLDAERRPDSSNLEEELRFLLEDSVKIRLRSDAEIGAFLSGGIDSSAVVRIASKHLSQQLDCISLRYEDYPSIDESHYSALVADNSDKYRIHWTRPSSSDVLEILPKIIWHHDGPCPIRGRLGRWALYREAAEHVKVVLSGDGSDELFAGYSRFVTPYLLDCLKAGERPIRERIGSIREAVGLLSDLAETPAQAVRMGTTGFARLFNLTGLPGMTHWLSGDFRNGLAPVAASQFHHTWLRQDVERPFDSHLNNALWQDFRFAGLPEALHEADALSMAFSLEVRAPFMDHRLVEFSFAVDSREKIQQGFTKSLLRRSMRGIVPEEVLARRDKKGVPTPHVRFIRANLPEIREILLEGGLVAEGVLSKRGVEWMFRRFNAPAIPLGTGLLCGIWACLCSELWHRQFLGGSRRL